MSGFDWREFIAYFVAVLIVAGFLAVQYWILSHPVTTDSKEIVLRTLGTLDALLVMVAQYLFGSSRGSKSKDRMLADRMDPPSGGG